MPRRASQTTRAVTELTYTERVNLAIDYVVGRLAEPVRLASVARAAHMSPFHFHRVFQAMVGETVADFVKRLRLDKSLFMMAHARGHHSRRSRWHAGFRHRPTSRAASDNASMSHRAGSTSTHGAVSHRSKLYEAAGAWAEHLHLQRLPEAPNPDRFKVKIRSLPARTVAYIRVFDPYREGAVVDATNRLLAWADRHAPRDAQWLGYQWDNPEIVPLEACQYHVAVEAEHFTAHGEIGRFTFPPMTVAQVEIRGGIDLELRALQWIFGAWLPRSGYVPDDHPCFEAWIGRPFAHGMEHFELYAQVPVRVG